MKRTSTARVVAAVLVVVGLFGVAVAVSGLLSPLPNPGTQETCGPGLGSEAAIIAIFDPVTIGAGNEPPASRAAAHANWVSFVHSCQSSADQRAAITFPVAVVSVAMVIAGAVLWRRRRPHPEDAPSGIPSRSAPPAIGAPPSGPGVPTVAMVFPARGPDGP